MFKIISITSKISPRVGIYFRYLNSDFYKVVEVSNDQWRCAWYDKIKDEIIVQEDIHCMLSLDFQHSVIKGYYYIVDTESEEFNDIPSQLKEYIYEGTCIQTKERKQD